MAALIPYLQSKKSVFLISTLICVLLSLWLVYDRKLVLATQPVEWRHRNHFLRDKPVFQESQILNTPQTQTVLKQKSPVGDTNRTPASAPTLRGTDGSAANWSRSESHQTWSAGSQPHKARAKTKMSEETGYSERQFSTSDNPRWLPMDGWNNDMYLYAAYYDDVEDPSIVRILVSMVGKSQTIPVVCVYFKPENMYNPVGTTEGLLSTYKPRIKASLTYHAGFVKCPLLATYRWPFSVSVVKVNNTNNRRLDHRAYTDRVTSVLQVHYSESDNRQMDSANDKPGSVRGRRIIKCFPCLHRYTKTMELIQQVEINQVLGVDKFYFYNCSVGSDVNSLLNYYQQTGVVKVLDWHFPSPMGKGVYFHQIEAIQDCFYRGLHSAQYILFGDLDEITVPRLTTNLQSLLDELFSQQPQCGSFLFFNAFFQNRPDSELPNFINSSFAKQYALNMLLTHDRVNEIWTNGRRAKLAVMPERVEVVSVHSVYILRGNYTQCPIPPTSGLLHHYRKAVPGHLGRRHSGLGLGYVSDHRLLNMSALIVPRVYRLLQQLNWL